MNKGRK